LDSKRVKIKEKRNKIRNYQRALTEYYSEGTSYGAPISKYLYTLAVNFARDDMDMLWFLLFD
jgi:hypothetical protein